MKPLAPGVAASLANPVSAADHAQGAADAKVTRVEDCDYPCPYCAVAYHVIKAVQKRMGARLRFVFRNRPLNQAHPYAELAAEAAEALVKRLKLDAGPFETDLQARKFQSHVKRDFSVVCAAA